MLYLSAVRSRHDGSALENLEAGQTTVAQMSVDWSHISPDNIKRPIVLLAALDKTQSRDCETPG